MSEHHGSCHCKRIRLILRETPPDAGECNCSVCRRTGGLWHHCHPDAVTAEGEGVSYQQGDRSLDLWHCPTCGCTTHWTPTDPTHDRLICVLEKGAMAAVAAMRHLMRQAGDDKARQAGHGAAACMNSMG